MKCNDPFQVTVKMFYSCLVKIYQNNFTHFIDFPNCSHLNFSTFIRWLRGFCQLWKNLIIIYSSSYNQVQGWSQHIYEQIPSDPTFTSLLRSNTKVGKSGKLSSPWTLNLLELTFFSGWYSLENSPSLGK
jgi:hypothetical protein